MSDTTKDEPVVVDPDNVHITGGKDEGTVNPDNVHITEAEDNGIFKPDNVHITSEPS
ncbi:hypothetical protein [Streptomyces sp. NPDC003710]